MPPEPSIDTAPDIQSLWTMPGGYFAEIRAGLLNKPEYFEIDRSITESVLVAGGHAIGGAPSSGPVASESKTPEAAEAAEPPPARGDEANADSTASVTVTPDAPGPRGRLKEPHRDAIGAYRAVRILGQKQETIAPRFGVDQGTISRWLKQVTKWLEAGNVLPDLDAPKPKISPMDPRKLEQAPRRRRAHK